MVALIEELRTTSRCEDAELPPLIFLCFKSFDPFGRPRPMLVSVSPRIAVPLLKQYCSSLSLLSWLLLSQLLETRHRNFSLSCSSLSLSSWLSQLLQIVTARSRRNYCLGC